MRDNSVLFVIIGIILFGLGIFYSITLMSKKTTNKNNNTEKSNKERAKEIIKKRELYNVKDLIKTQNDVEDWEYLSQNENFSLCILEREINAIQELIDNTSDFEVQSIERYTSLKNEMVDLSNQDDLCKDIEASIIYEGTLTEKYNSQIKQYNILLDKLKKEYRDMYVYSLDKIEETEQMISIDNVIGSSKSKEIITEEQINIVSETVNKLRDNINDIYDNDGMRKYDTSFGYEPIKSLETNGYELIDNIDNTIKYIINFRK